MRAQLMFNLNDPDDLEKFQEVTSEKAANLRLAIHNFSQEVLRKYRKYGVPLRDIFPEGSQIPTDPHELSQALIEHIEKRFYDTLDEFEAEVR